MRNLTSSLSIGLLTFAMVAAGGCGQQSGIDFSQLPLANEAEEGDSSHTGGRIFTWMRPSTDQIRCVRAPCPITFVNDVNLGKSHLLYGYDWRALQLKPEEQEALERDAAKLLLYGKYATAQLSGEEVLVYQVTRANPQVTEESYDRPESDGYYKVKAADPTCQQGSCGYTAVLMNRGQTEQWTSIDLSRLRLPASARQILLGELQQGTASVSVEDANPYHVVVTQAFRPYNAEPLPTN